MIVIDTHALVWYFQNDDQLERHAETVIEEARRGDGVLVPAIVAWETAMLVDKGRLALGMDPGLWFARVFGEPGFALAQQNISIGIDAGTLPEDIHGDPADRLIIATARAAQAPLLTGDEKILRYAAAGHLKAVDARR